MGNVVQFYKGLSANLPDSSQRSEDALYFTTDTHRIYVGSHEYSYYLAGSGIAITGNVVSVEGFGQGDIDDITSVKPTPKTLDIDDLGDVNTSDVSGGESLIYDSTSGKWVNGYSSAVKWTNF